MKIPSPGHFFTRFRNWLASEPDRLFLDTVTKLRKDHAQTILSKKLEAITLHYSILAAQQRYELLRLAEAGGGLDGENGRWLGTEGSDFGSESFAPSDDGYNLLPPDFPSLDPNITR